uniref:Uncharacterized protein n=1 Tax=Rhizophora mucronata TaxID=61149 RepID=A0A2P2PQ58_RHIMU
MKFSTGKRIFCFAFGFKRKTDISTVIINQKYQIIILPPRRHLNGQGFNSNLKV